MWICELEEVTFPFRTAKRHSGGCISQLTHSLIPGNCWIFPHLPLAPYPPQCCSGRQRLVPAIIASHPSLMPPVTVAKSCTATARTRLYARVNLGRRFPDKVAGVSFKIGIPGNATRGTGEKEEEEEEEQGRIPETPRASRSKEVRAQGARGNDEKRRLWAREARGILIFIPATSAGRESCGRTARGLICYP